MPNYVNKGRGWLTWRPNLIKVRTSCSINWSEYSWWKTAQSFYMQHHKHEKKKTCRQRNLTQFQFVNHTSKSPFLSVSHFSDCVCLLSILVKNVVYNAPFVFGLWLPPYCYSLHSTLLPFPHLNGVRHNGCSLGLSPYHTICPLWHKRETET